PVAGGRGGRAPLIVLEDADWDGAIGGAIVPKFRNSGQSCIASNRLYVQRPVYASFVDRFVEKVRRLKVTDGLEERCDVGPLVNEAAVAHALSQIEDAVDRGAQLRCGGHRLPRRGFFLQP